MENKSSRSKVISFLFIHAAFLVYTLYPLIGKYATRYEMFSFQFIALYCVVFGILFIYAFLWQQVLKRFPLTTAIANKSITIIWGMIFGLLLFGEPISLKMIIGTVLILFGILILSTEKMENEE